MSNIVCIDIPRRINDTRLSVQRVDSQRRRTALVVVVVVVKSGPEVDELIMREERIEIEIGVF